MLFRSKTEHQLEIKTANDKRFKAFVKLGIRGADLSYYCQVQRYMRKTGLRRTLFIVTNKNDEQRYYERIKYDPPIADALFEKEVDIISVSSPPKDKFAPTWYACKWCKARDICHGNDVPEVNCRTCTHSDLYNDGRWTCTKKGINLDREAQESACEKHQFISELIASCR